MSKAQVQRQTRWISTGQRKEESLDSFIKIIKSLTSSPKTIRELSEDSKLCDKTIRRYIKVLSCHFLIQEFGEPYNKHDPPKFYIKKLF